MTDEYGAEKLCGEAILTADAALRGAASNCRAYEAAGRLVAELAGVVGAGHAVAAATYASAAECKRAVTGVWACWRAVKPVLRRHRLLIGGSGFSASVILLAAFLWPHPAAMGAGEPQSDCATGDREVEVVTLIRGREWGAAERACEGLPTGRRYLLLGECARGRGDEVTARWCYRRAADSGETCGELALKK